jgi:hypothetical protein
LSWRLFWKTKKAPEKPSLASASGSIAAPVNTASQWLLQIATCDFLDIYLSVFDALYVSQQIEAGTSTEGRVLKYELEDWKEPQACHRGRILPFALNNSDTEDDAEEVHIVAKDAEPQQVTVGVDNEPDTVLVDGKLICWKMGNVPQEQPLSDRCSEEVSSYLFHSLKHVYVAWIVCIGSWMRASCVTAIYRMYRLR